METTRYGTDDSDQDEIIGRWELIYMIPDDLGVGKGLFVCSAWAGTCVVS